MANPNLLVVCFAFLLLLLLFDTVSSASFSAQASGYTIQIDPWGQDSFRVRVSSTSTIVQTPDVQALLPVPPPPTNDNNNNEAGFPLINGNLQVTVSNDTGLASFVRISDGALLLTQTSLSFLGSSLQTSFQGSPNELLYGMGEHRFVGVQIKPFYQLFQESEDYAVSHGSDINIPFYTSSLGYGFLWNIPAFGFCNLTDDALVWNATVADQLDFWVTTTPAGLNASTDSPYATLLNRYVDATGHALPLPFWASGFWQSKNRYRNQTQLLAIAQEYFARQIPLSVIVIDWFHWVNFGDWSFNEACWPDPGSLIETLHEMGVEVMVSVWPLVSNASTNFEPMLEQDLLVTNVSGAAIITDNNCFLYDAFSPDARSYVFDAVNKGYLSYGIKTYWLDASEPEQFNIVPGQKLYSTGIDEKVGMAYSQQHARTFHDGLVAQGIPEGEFIMLARHAWAGAQRYGAAVWSGDINSTFEELGIQIKVAQGVAMSGLPWWTTDIGGYRGGDPTDPTFQELIVRWFQFGAFCPLFRIHGQRAGGDPPDACGATNGPNEVWEFGETAYPIIVGMINLRESLRPYIMENLQATADSGLPILRPMFLEFPSDPLCADSSVEDQFMFGPDWLVAPVYVSQAPSRSVYLPALPSGQVWVHHYTLQAFTGGARLSFPTPLDSFPLFARTSTIPQPVVAASNLWSSSRNDTCLCVSIAAYQDQQSQQYEFERIEGYIPLGNYSEGMAPLNLFYSYTHSDNDATTASSPPDATYTVLVPDGYVFTSYAEGLIPLYQYFNAERYDHLSVASQEGIQYALENNYEYVALLGYIYASPPSA